MYIHRQSAYLLGRQRHVSNHIDTAVIFVVINVALTKTVIIINIRGQIENRPLQNTRSVGRK